MSMVLIFILVITGISCLPFLIKRFIGNYKPMNRTIKIIVNVLCVLSLSLLFCSLIMANNNYYFRGYKTTTYILLLSVIVLILNYLINKYKSKLKAKIIEALLFVFIFISTIILIINLIGYSNGHFYSDNNYSLEKYTFIKSPSGQLPVLYVKKGLFEKKHHLIYLEKERQLVHESYVDNDLINNYQIIKTDSNYRVIFTFNDETEIITETYEK